MTVSANICGLIGLTDMVLDIQPESRLMLTQSLLPEGSLPDPLH